MVRIMKECSFYFKSVSEVWDKYNKIMSLILTSSFARVKFKHLKMYTFEGFDQEPTKEIIFISIRDLDVQARWEELVGCRESHLEEVASTKELSNMNLCMLWVSFVWHFFFYFSFCLDSVENQCRQLCYLVATKKKRSINSPSPTLYN